MKKMRPPLPVLMSAGQKPNQKQASAAIRVIDHIFVLINDREPCGAHLIMVKDVTTWMFNFNN